MLMSVMSYILVICINAYMFICISIRKIEAEEEESTKTLTANFETRFLDINSLKKTKDINKSHR